VRTPSVAEQISRTLPELYALTPIEAFPAHALALTRRVVGGDKADYTEVDLDRGDFRVLVDPEPPLLGRLGPARGAHMHQHPVLRHFLQHPGSGACQISDFLTRREFHRTPLYGEFFGLLGVEHQLTAVVADPSSRHLAGISIDRGRPGFGERDRELLDALRPHLIAARSNAFRFSRALGSGPAGELQPGLDRLTDRQREVLAKVAAGHTNGQIALALDISLGTVRKHLEHILRGLGVSTRTAAAARYLNAARPAPGPDWTAAIPAMVTGSS
jgi:DNA-binding CsgD family transcriptional regulator